jgi:hypothetical protein
MHRHLSLAELPRKVAELGNDYIERSPAATSRLVGQAARLVAVRFDDIVTSCVIAWEERGDESGRALRRGEGRGKEGRGQGLRAACRAPLNEERP